MPRIPDPLLFSLRNHIPIDVLIANILLLPCKKSEGYWRFLCPICQEFRTAVNKRTNLARCFLCQKNFNPIDIAMLVMNCNFLQAVDFLKLVLAEDTLCKRS